MNICLHNVWCWPRSSSSITSSPLHRTVRLHRTWRSL